MEGGAGGPPALAPSTHPPPPLPAILAAESPVALVAGVNTILWGDVSAGICALRALSPAGRCRPSACR